jgi:hypothetical protein
MDFDVRPLSTRLSELDGIGDTKASPPSSLYPSSSNAKDSKFHFLNLPIEIQILIVREYVQD